MPAAARRWIARLGLVLWLVVLTWPTVPLFSAEIMAAPGEEAATHIWGHTAALRGEGPLHLQSLSLGYPDGQAFPLIDLGSLPVVALGRLLGGLVGGYNLLVLAAVALAGLAGAAWARLLSAPRAPAAAFAMASPALIATFAEGMTEAFWVGLVPLQLATAVAAVRSGRPATLGLAALLLVGCAATGPYNGLWAAILNAALLLWLGRRGLGGPAVRAQLGRLVGVGLVALALSAPLIGAALEDRAGLSGGVQQRGLPPAPFAPEAFRGGLPAGADLLDGALPLALTGGAAPISHTTYLGLSLLLLAPIAVIRRQRRWPALAACVGLWALSLGAHLSLGGQPLRVASHALLGPVGLATVALPALGRVSRWYRAAAVIGPLIGALASAGLPRRPAQRAVVLAICLGDLLLLGPQAWPLMHSAPPPTPPAVLAHDDAAQPAVMELPPTTTGPPPPGGWRDETALQQAIHGKPVAGTIMNAPMNKGVAGAQHKLMRALPTGAPLGPPLAALHRLGFGLLWLHTDRLRFPPESLAALAACLGPPVSQSSAHHVYALHAGGCAAPPVAPPSTPR